VDYYDDYDDFDDFEVYEDAVEIYQRRPPYRRPTRPSPPRRPWVSPCPRGTIAYSAGFGDTIFRIARAFGVSANDIVRFNPRINQRPLYVGQRVCVPVRRR
jgi:hypothetical protein